MHITNSIYFYLLVLQSSSSDCGGIKKQIDEGKVPGLIVEVAKINIMHCY